MNIEIIYEDKDIAVINKPPGVVVNEAKTVQEETIQKWFWEKHDGFKGTRKASYQKLIPEDFEDTFGTPEEISNLVVFLCSEKSSFITGSTFVADGGQTKS